MKLIYTHAMMQQDQYRDIIECKIAKKSENNGERDRVEQRSIDNGIEDCWGEQSMIQRIEWQVKALKEVQRGLDILKKAKI